MKRLSLIIPMVALVLVLSALGCSSGSPDPELALKARSDGFELLKQGLYAEAIPYFDKAIKAAPNDAIAYSLLETVF